MTRTPRHAVDLQAGAFAAVALALLLAACGGDDNPKPGPVDTFCTAGQLKCVGNYIAECVEEGKAYKLTFCGETKSCTGTPPVCKAVSCAGGKAARSCSGDQVMQCEADGLAEAQASKTCGGDQGCIGGECVPKACKSGETRCGWKELLTCSGSAWTSTKCGPTQYCDSAAKACVERVCVPTSVQCKGEKTASTCAIDGGKFVDHACPAGQLCYDGVCHAEVKGKAADKADAVADGGATDTGPVTKEDAGAPVFTDLGKKEVQFEEPSTLEVILSETASPAPGTKSLFFDIVDASYLPNDQMLQLTGDLDLMKIEIQIAPVEEFQTGSFTALGGEAEKSAIYMNDGSDLPGNVQWRFQSSEYSIKLSKFEDVDGRIIGTFNADLKDALDKTKTWYLVGGKFNILRK